MGNTALPNGKVACHLLRDGILLLQQRGGPASHHIRASVQLTRSCGIGRSFGSDASLSCTGTHYFAVVYSSEDARVSLCSIQNQRKVGPTKQQLSMCSALFYLVSGIHPHIDFLPVWSPTTMNSYSKKTFPRLQPELQYPNFPTLNSVISNGRKEKEKRIFSSLENSLLSISYLL